MNNRNYPAIQNPKCNKAFFSVIISIIFNGERITGKILGASTKSIPCFLILNLRLVTSHSNLDIVVTFCQYVKININHYFSKKNR